MAWGDVFDFGEQFWDLRGDAEAAHASAFQAELDVELSPGHPLYGQHCRVIAKALPQDDIVVACSDRVALVHLTWTSRSEAPPLPRVDYADSAAAFRKLVEFRY